MSQSVFNRQLLRHRHQRLKPRYYQYSKLHRYAALSLQERLSCIKKEYQRILVIGDIDFAILNVPETTHVIRINGQVATLGADSEFLPFAPASFDLVISSFDLHCANDVPGLLAQIKFILKPDGLFQGVFLGGNTFSQLRQATLLAEELVRGGITPRVAPMISLPDAAALLQRVGFGLPVADVDKLQIAFDSIDDLLGMIKKCGLTNGLWQQAKGLMSKALLQEIVKQYCDLSGSKVGITEAFDLIFVSGWAPSAKQQQALKRGSGQHSLIAALEQT